MDEKKARVREELDACLKRCEAILHGDEADTSSAAGAAPSPQGEGCEGMTAEREGRILEGAIRKWGTAKQVDVAIEEMCELIQAIMKLRRKDSIKKTSPDIPERQHILEELADVIIMTKQLELIYGDVTEWEIQKLERLERMVQSDS